MKGASNRLREALQGCKGQLCYTESKNIPFEFPHNCSVVDSAPLARAAHKGIAYACLGHDQAGRDVRDNFDEIGQEVEKRWLL